MESKDTQEALKPITKEPKYGRVVSAVSGLSLGISMVVAVLLGVGIGMWLKNLTGQTWTLWLGVFWGVGGACYNLVLAYKRQQREMKELQNDPKYREYKDIEETLS